MSLELALKTGSSLEAETALCPPCSQRTRVPTLQSCLGISTLLPGHHVLPPLPPMGAAPPRSSLHLNAASFPGCRLRPWLCLSFLPGSHRLRCLISQFQISGGRWRVLLRSGAAQSAMEPCVANTTSSGGASSRGSYQRKKMWGI